MSFHRTDKGKIDWPTGIRSDDRRFCREVYSNIKSFHSKYEVNRKDKSVLIGCSAGLDSTVLAHANAQTRVIQGFSGRDVLVYVNHNLRTQSETDADEKSVRDLANSLGCEFELCIVNIPDGNVQSLAREERYSALTQKAAGRRVLLAHHANDVAETKLWQFLTGREVTGISDVLDFNGEQLMRPLLDFTREDLERYARIWNLSWQEDSSNGTNKYARNRIRHELIPWIERELNPGIVKVLSRG